MHKSRLSSSVVIFVCVALLPACTTTKEIRVHNISELDFTDVVFGGEPWGDIAAGEITDYRTVKTRSGYVVMYLKVNGHRVNVQSLYLCSKRFTHRIGIKNLEAGHMAGEVIRE